MGGAETAAAVVKTPAKIAGLKFTMKGKKPWNQHAVKLERLITKELLSTKPATTLENVNNIVQLILEDSDVNGDVDCLEKLGEILTAVIGDDETGLPNILANLGLNDAETELGSIKQITSTLTKGKTIQAVEVQQIIAQVENIQKKIIKQAQDQIVNIMKQLEAFTIAFVEMWRSGNNNLVEVAGICKGTTGATDDFFKRQKLIDTVRTAYESIKDLVNEVTSASLPEGVVGTELGTAYFGSAHGFSTSAEYIGVNEKNIPNPNYMANMEIVTKSALDRWIQNRATQYQQKFETVLQKGDQINKMTQLAQS